MTEMVEERREAMWAVWEDSEKAYTTVTPSPLFSDRRGVLICTRVSFQESAVGILRSIIVYIYNISISPRQVHLADPISSSH